LLPLGAAQASPGGEGLEEVRTVTRWVGDSVAALLSHPGDAEPTQPRPAVILLSDGLGVDGRADLYARRLLSLGIAVLDIDFGEVQADDLGKGGGESIAVERRLGMALQALAGDPTVDPRRLGVIGIGTGGRAVLLGRPGDAPLAAAVLLYPGCDGAMADAARGGAPALAGVPVMLLHGDADPVNEPRACAALTEELRGHAACVTHRVLPEATYAWDLPLNGALGTGAALLPDPTGVSLRIRAEPDPMRAQIALDRILGFLLPALMPRWER
jgi:dienelactone hydrolase